MLVIPKGHPKIQTPLLSSALDEKLALAERQRLGSYVITQFCFAPNRITHFCIDLKRRAREVPVYVGVPGPVSPTKLLHFARKCGVGASLRALEAQGLSAIRLFTHTDPTKLLMSLTPHLLAPQKTNMVGIHVFSFGGVKQAAQWINTFVHRH